ncbi:MAG: pantoate--beta-alanine ligase [Desulfobulbus propionicus]|nr:MAG: pantoate--beta-alanine ligase [Desulfobulbus propionicus]
MKIIKDPETIAEWARGRHARRQRIALVPTMGFFHDGHLSLMRRAGELADQVVVSLFVNPTQFGPGEDLEAYPRDVERDVKLAAASKVNVLFAPETHQMYPEGFLTGVRVAEISESLCGRDRPVHFQGVATVVCKLFNMIDPDVAVFGNKDYQQLVLIRRMARDLNFQVKVVGHPIVREADGLAMSSRNAYLRPEDRSSALSLFSGLQMARQLVAAGERRGQVLCERVRAHILTHPKTSVDYVSVVNKNTMGAVDVVDQDSLMAVAVKVAGKVRLIDNSLLQGGDEECQDVM